jgi:hypothetical protein
MSSREQLPTLAARVVDSSIVLVRMPNTGIPVQLDIEIRKLLAPPFRSYTNEEVAQILANS